MGTDGHNYYITSRAIAYSKDLGTRVVFHYIHLFVGGSIFGHVGVFQNSLNSYIANFVGSQIHCEVAISS